MTASMHRGELSPIGGPSRAVTLGAQLIKDIQHGLFARVHEGAAGDVLGVLQKLFGFGGCHGNSFACCRWSHRLVRPRCKSSCNALIFPYGDFGGIRAAIERFLRFLPYFEAFQLEKGLGYHKPIL